MVDLLQNPEIPILVHHPTSHQLLDTLRKANCTISGRPSLKILHLRITMTDPWILHIVQSIHYHFKSFSC